MEEYPCFTGQWSIHPPHIYETLNIRLKRGGGRMLCPGKTKETVLGFRPGVTREFATEEEFREFRAQFISPKD